MVDLLTCEVAGREASCVRLRKSSTVARAQGNPVWTITVLLKDNPALNWSNIS